MKGKTSVKKSFLYSLRHSIPILIGFFPTGVAYGILMQSIGYNAAWVGLSSIVVFAGSLQFLMVSFLGGGVSLITVAVLSLLLNSRHIFYGLSFIERFGSYKKLSKWFLVYSLADECYSLHCDYKQEEGVNEEAAFVMTGALVVCYWLVFTMLGAVIGNLISFDTTGIDFALTALFIVILLDQIRGAKSRLPLYIAGISSIVSIIIFGTANFILPSLIFTTACLCLCKGRIEKENTAETEVRE